MKTIVVPTDFSANAENALHFAIVLAKVQKAKLVLVHAFQAPLMVTAVPGTIFRDEINALKKKADKKLRTQCIKIEHAGNITYEYIAEEGDTIKVILKVVKEINPDFVIMGTKGETDLEQLMFGSNTSEIIEKATCPIMAIPSTARFNRPIKKIAYATDYLLSDIDAIRKMVEIAEPLKAQINILHVAQGVYEAEEEASLMGKFINRVQEKINYPHITYEVLNGEDVAERLENYIGRGEVDIIVLSTLFRNYFGRLFSDSITKSLVHLSDIPLVAFHHSKITAEKVF